MKILRRIAAIKYGVPFKDRVWYNRQAMLKKEEYNKRPHINIWDSNGNYITCPKCGETVEYVVKGVRYKYKIVGFKNESPNRDWLFGSDYIHPIIEFLKIVK